MFITRLVGLKMASGKVPEDGAEAGWFKSSLAQQVLCGQHQLNGRPAQIPAEQPAEQSDCSIDSQSSRFATCWMGPATGQQVAAWRAGRLVAETARGPIGELAAKQNKLAPVELASRASSMLFAPMGHD